MLKLQEPDWSLHLENRLITFATYKQTDFCSTVSLGGNAQYSKVKTPSCFSIRCSTHFIPSCCSCCQLFKKHLSHEQAIRVLVVELDDVGQLVRLSREVERVGVLHLVTNSVK